jgi:hypothetical protein
MRKHSRRASVDVPGKRVENDHKTRKGPGECDRGYHNATPTELAAMTAVLEAGRAAVPAPPEGCATGGAGGIGRARITQILCGLQGAWGSQWTLTEGENGAGRGTRTPDPPLTKRMLYQLSYAGNGEARIVPQVSRYRTPS